MKEIRKGRVILMTKTFNRRDFLKGGLVLGGAAEAAGLAGCAPTTKGDKQQAQLATTGAAGGIPENWDYEADVIVVGCGAAGMAALNEARAQDLTVIGIEQANMIGGNAAICGGEMCCVGTPLQKAQGIDDSPEKLYEDMCALGADVNEEMMKLYSELTTELYDWVTGFGVEVEEEVHGTNGHTTPRGHFVLPGPGEALGVMRDAAEAAGAEIHLQTALTSLIQDPATKRVIGVVAEDSHGDQLLYKANRGVIMASGGYAQNNDLINEYVTGVGAENFKRQGRDTDNGTGIIACMNIGVASRRMSYCSFSCILNADGDATTGSAMYHCGGILVNQEGERFVDESNGYTNVWTSVVDQTDQIAYCIWDQAIADANNGQGGEYYDHSKAEASGLLLKGDTIEELAAAIGCPAEVLQATMDQYNGDVEATGVDSVFGRDNFVTGTGDLVPLNHAPYYAWKTCIAIGSSRGGLKKDISCQAVDMSGNIVPGLFLAGVISGTSEMGIVPGTRQSKSASGTGFGGALCFGRYCAQQIASIMEPWDQAAA